MDRFFECFCEIEDPRAANASHDLVELLFIALLASLCGAQNCEEYSEFGHAKHKLLSRFLCLQNGIPSHDTFSRVFRLLDPKGFERAFRDFMSKFAEGLDGVVALDGKSLRRAYDKGKSCAPCMMVSAFAAQTRLTLASLPTIGGDERSAVLYLIDLLNLKGSTVTADALHCNDEMALAVLDAKGDYVLRVKANQPILLTAAQNRIEANGGKGCKGCKRQEKRGCQTIIRKAHVCAADIMADCFPGLKAVGRITIKSGSDAPEERYYLLSRFYKPDELLDITRSHWAIENNLHWVLDTAFGEDNARSRKDNAPYNLATLRRLALNIASMHPDKTPMRRKLKRAAWDEEYLFQLINHMR